MTDEEETRAEFDLTGNFVYNILYVQVHQLTWSLCIRVWTLMVIIFFISVYKYLQTNKDGDEPFRVRPPFPDVCLKKNCVSLTDTFSG
jgi:hypothetical protein